MEYVKPEIADYGNLTELTAGQSEGEALDQDFPIHTPKKDLLFS
jgi:hypothetical protein